jgi:hypothetical protein
MKTPREHSDGRVRGDHLDACNQSYLLQMGQLCLSMLKHEVPHKTKNAIRGKGNIVVETALFPPSAFSRLLELLNTSIPKSKNLTPKLVLLEDDIHKFDNFFGCSDWSTQYFTERESAKIEVITITYANTDTQFGKLKIYFNVNYHMDGKSTRID